MAAVLAEAGLDVVVLEAGPRVETSEFNGDEAEMTAKLWKLGLAVDSGLSLYAGACVGGSTVINDALCFRTPPEVLARWRSEHGLAGFSDAAFAPYVEQAWQDLHAEDTGPEHMSRNARALERGAKRLGWQASATPRSVRGCVNFGLCNFGCPSGAKQSTLVSYIPRAERAGARVLAGLRVERVVVASGRARGVEATRIDSARRVTGTVRVDAPIVCVAAGVLSTPAILQQSGLRAGDGLQCHGSVHVSAKFAEPIYPYYGPTMAYAVRELADVAGGRGPGVMIESVAGHPVATASSLAGFGAEHAARMAELSNLARALVVMRDRTRGRIDADGTVRYAPTVEDLTVLRTGMLAAARCYLAAGAEEVWLPVHGAPAIRSEDDLAALSDLRFTSRKLAHHYAVHLFGGASMAASAEHGVCDENGACFEAEGLYVTDASSLPSNTGINPQITIVANALRIAAGIAARWPSEASFVSVANELASLNRSAAALDRRSFLRLVAIATASGLLPTGCGGVPPALLPTSGATLIVLGPRSYATFTAAAARIVGPAGAELIARRTIDVGAAADAWLARTPELTGPLTQALVALEYGVWPLFAKVRTFTALDDQCARSRAHRSHAFAPGPQAGHLSRDPLARAADLLLSAREPSAYRLPGPFRQREDRHRLGHVLKNRVRPYFRENRA